VGSEDVNKLTK